MGLSPNTADAAPGVDPFRAQGGDFLRDIWYVALPARDLKPGKLLSRKYLGEPIVLGRDAAGRAFALKDICPHRAAPFSAGRLVREDSGATSVECPYHGWRFGTSDGVCAAIPSLVDGQPFELERIRVRRYPVAEQDDIIWIWMGSADAEPDAPPPRLANRVLKAGQTESKVKFVESAVLACHQDHAVIGLIDPAHTPFVHQSPLWRTPKGLKPKEKHFEPTELGFTMVSHKPVNSPLYDVVIGGDIRVEIQFLIPGLRAEAIRNQRYQYLGLAAVTPIDETSSQIHQIMYWNVPALDVLKLIARPFTHTFLQQDARMMRLQGQGLKYDPPLMQIPDADTLMVWYRHLKREWVKSREEGRDFVNPVKPATLRWRT